MKPFVSINMCVYNGEKYLAETLQTIISQTFQNWELIIVNDGSTDSSEDIIFALKKKEDRFVYHFQQNKGLAYSRNKAIEMSSGHYIAFIDQDDLWMPDKLEKQLNCFKNNPNAGIITSDTIFFNASGDVKQFFNKKKPPTGKIFRDLLRRYFIHMETVMIRREAIESIDSWFDIRMQVNEEKDLFLRIAHNWEVDYVDEPLSKWRMHSDSGTFMKKERFPKENEMILDKLRSLYHNFDNEYQNEIRFFKANISNAYALLEWEKGNNYGARIILSPYLAVCIKTVIIYLLTLFFPYRVYKFLNSLRGWDPS